MQFYFHILIYFENHGEIVQNLTTKFETGQILVIKTWKKQIEIND